MPWKEIQEHLVFFLCPCVKSNNWFSYITLSKTYCQSSRRLSVSETPLPCGLVVHINLVIECFVQASDDRLLKMRIDHHNQQLLWLINRLFPIIGISVSYVHHNKVIYKISAQYLKACRRKMRKTVTDGRTDGDPDGRTNGHHHTKIRPVWRRAYKNFNICHNCFVLRGRAFIFGKCVPYDKAFPM